ncbi:2-C-methyl-D-erythritol 4-phosphate cytidylyltransferase [Sulfitobacter geojensis]|uniref:2-C-methyl-D-erythritol 4-phosphate cytidylyltransferase n=1 Tax=Sulfitobacter geojensis TaxID=1342299 RepID=UPI002492D6E6|nr:2-C-methyl-D-erythritol 4-phosphate cytidylyltransferase [Sulfitobacter geojensis]
MSDSPVQPRKVTAILIVAAGRGRRFRSDVPKQYLPILGICAFRRCLDTFLDLAEVSCIQTVIHRDDQKAYAQAIEGLNDSRLLPASFGGETRVESVLNGLTALADHKPDTVLVHDGARAFVTQRIVRDVMAALVQSDAAFAALPVVDALWRAEGDRATSPVARDGLWRAQTPQGFRFDVLREAHLAYQGDAADDVEIVRAMGTQVKIVRGDPANFKITTPDDLQRAERFVAGDTADKAQR